MANRIRSADQASATEFTIVGSEMEATTWESYLSGLDEVVDSYRSEDIDSPTSLAGFERELRCLRVSCGSTVQTSGSPPSLWSLPVANGASYFQCTSMARQLCGECARTHGPRLSR